MRKMVIPSKLTELPRVQQAVLDAARLLGFGKEAIFAIRLALDEAVSNAIVHGNKSDPAKEVIIEFGNDGDDFRMDVTDQGCGFCPENLPDPTHEENLTSPHGRGVMLIEAYMTEVRYYRPGNRISMIKRRGCCKPHAHP